MNADTIPANNTFRILADKPDGEIVAGNAIKLPSGEVVYRPSGGWPQRGITYVGGWPDQMTVSTRLIEGYAARGLVTIEGARTVVRPSRPDPDTDENGSATIRPEHTVPDGTNPSGMPMPHNLPQADAIIFHDPDQGPQRYTVTRNPDKYVAGDETGEQQVTLEVYASGETDVEWSYTLTRSNTGKES